jgi:hypothetical protein
MGVVKGKLLACLWCFLWQIKYIKYIKVLKPNLLCHILRWQLSGVVIIIVQIHDWCYAHGKHSDQSTLYGCASEVYTTFHVVVNNMASRFLSVSRGYLYIKDRRVEKHKIICCLIYNHVIELWTTCKKMACEVSLFSSNALILHYLQLGYLLQRY